MWLMCGHSVYDNADIYMDLLTGFPYILKPNTEGIQLKPLSLTL